MKVMILVIAKSDIVPRPPTNEALLAMHQFNEELEKAGVLLDLGGLMPPNQGVRIKTTAGKRTVTDGPFAEAKEFVAGYSVLQVKDMAEALEWARRAPTGDDDVIVEVRPLFDPSMFDPPKQ